MATINFYLKGALSNSKISSLQRENPSLLRSEMEKKKLILVRIIESRRLIQKSTGLSCSQLIWDKNKMRTKNKSSGMSENLRINGKLSEIEKNVRFLIEENEKFNESITVEQIECAVEPEFIRARKSPTFKELVECYIRDYSLIHNKALEPNTIKKYTTLIKHIASYHEFIGHNFNVGTINEPYVFNFKIYLTQDLFLNDNSAIKYLKGLKSILNYATRKNLIRVNMFDNIAIKEREASPIALTSEELELLNNVKLNKAQSEMIRDLFLFMCYTGQRFSDIQNISSVDIAIENESTIWCVPVKKTNSLIRIVLSNKATCILDRYKSPFSPLPRFSNPFFNREIKIIANLAGLNRLIKKIDYRNGKQLVKTIPLYDFISTHTARKTFVSLLLQNGISELDIRTITGHRDNRSFARYSDLKDSHCDRINVVFKKLHNTSV